MCSDSTRKAKKYANRVCLKCEGNMIPIDIVSNGGANMPLVKYVCYECEDCHSILYTPKNLAKKK